LPDASMRGDTGCIISLSQFYDYAVSHPQPGTTYTFNVINGVQVFPAPQNGVEVWWNNTGPYRIVCTATDQYGCSSTDSISICEIISGIHPASMNDALNIFPNPAGSKIYVKQNQGLNPEELKLFDVFGQLIPFSYSRIQHDQYIELDISSLAKGVYFLRMDEGGSGRFVKE